METDKDTAILQAAVTLAASTTDRTRSERAELLTACIADVRKAVRVAGLQLDEGGALAAPSVVEGTKPDKKIYDELTDAVIGALQHFDYIDREGPPHTAAEAIALSLGGRNRYRGDPIFRAKVQMLVDRVAKVVLGQPVHPNCPTCPKHQTVHLSKENIMVDLSAQLPQYRSHKTVQAVKIKEIEYVYTRTHSYHTELDGATISPEEHGLQPFHVPLAYLLKHQPQVGGYYVLYPDGYESFSPAKAFEDGYDRVEPPHA